jgi:hypothetical protein
MLHKGIVNAGATEVELSLRTKCSNDKRHNQPLAIKFLHWPSRGVGCFKPTVGVQKANIWRLKTRLLWVDGAQ